MPHEFYESSEEILGIFAACWMVFAACWVWDTIVSGWILAEIGKGFR